MIYLFRKNNGCIAIVTGAAAWEMFTSNGNWKYRPQYLGAVQDAAYMAIKEKIQEAFPISPDLTDAVNTGEKARDRELRGIQQKRIELEKTLMEALVASADKTITPPNMDVVNKESIPREYHRMLGNVGKHV